MSHSPSPTRTNSKIVDFHIRISYVFEWFKLILDIDCLSSSASYACKQTNKQKIRKNESINVSEVEMKQ